MRRNLVFLSILTVLIVGSILFGVYTRTSYLTTNVAFSNYSDRDDIVLNLNDSESFLSIYFNNQIQTAAELEALSEFIVKVKVTKDRVNYAQAVKSAVQVLDVYKGDASLRGNTIYIFEPSHFFNNVYLSLGGYQLMQTDKQYLLFLNPLKVPNPYTYKNDEAISYMPVSSYYSKFPVQQEQLFSETTKALSEQEIEAGIPFAQINNLELLTANEQILTTYKALKNVVFTIF